jgi:glutathione S-transferase
MMSGYTPSTFDNCPRFLTHLRLIRIGPMQGQAAHFYRYAPTKIQYAVDCYINETRRVCRVLDTHLAKSE